jgi:hypothetical protein
MTDPFPLLIALQVCQLFGVIFSFRLFLRGLLPLPSNYAMTRKHQLLLSQSLVYRLHVHLL